MTGCAARRMHLCGSEGGEGKKRGTRSGLAARIGGEAFTVLENCWVIPAEALHDMEELPGKEGLRAMPPFQELSL